MPGVFIPELGDLARDKVDTGSKREDTHVFDVIGWQPSTRNEGVAVSEPRSYPSSVSDRVFRGAASDSGVVRRVT